jgi:hypothetical protein
LVFATAACGRIDFDELDTGPLVCPANYVASGGGCYRDYYSPAQGDGKTFVDAEVACEADGPGIHLAVVTDATEAQALAKAIDSDNQDFWIGVTDLKQAGTYLNVTGTLATYLVWAPTEPTGNTHCLIMSNVLLLADQGCIQLDDYVCEYDGLDPVPAVWGQ